MSPVPARPPKNNFVPAPEGVYVAVCADVIDLGEVETTWKGKTGSAWKIRVVWEIEQEMEDGKRFAVFQRYTNTTHMKGRVWKDMASIFGRTFLQEEREGFDFECLIGKCCMIQILHSEPDFEGKVYANISSMMPLPKGADPLVIRDYEREKSAQAPIEDEDIPF
jgi:hypothetical protein